MTLRGFLFLIALTDLLAWAGWATVLFKTTPEGGLPILFVFYASLLLALLGLFAVIGFCVRVCIFKRDELVSLYVKRTFRQGFFLATLVVVSLILIHLQLLHSWTVLGLLAALGLGEHILVSREHA